MAIAKYWLEFSEDFAIYGEHQQEWQLFERNKPFTAFIIHLETSSR